MMTEKDNIRAEDYMPDIDLDDIEMDEMNGPMMQCPMMQCPMMQCPMMHHPMHHPMKGFPMMKNKYYGNWDMEDLYVDDDSDYSSDDKELYYDKKSEHGWYPHPYYKRK